MSVGYTVIVLCVLGQIGAEAEIYILYEDAEVVSVDPEYFDPGTDLFITDDNQVAANYSIVKKFPLLTDCRFTLLGYSMGKYDIPTGFDWSHPFCDKLREPIIFAPYFTQTGMSPESCPPEPANYIQEGYTIPPENLPETFPENRYMINFDINYLGKPLFASKVYVDIRN